MIDFKDVLKGMAYTTSAVGIVGNAVLGYAFFFKYPYIKAMQDSGQGLHRVVWDIGKADLYDRRDNHQRTYYASRAERVYPQQSQQPNRRVKAQKSERARTRKEKRQVAVVKDKGGQQEYDYDAVRVVSQRANIARQNTAASVQAAVLTPVPQIQESVTARVVREPQQPENGEVRSRSLRKVADQ